MKVLKGPKILFDVLALVTNGESQSTLSTKNQLIQDSVRNLCKYTVKIHLPPWKLNELLFLQLATEKLVN